MITPKQLKNHEFQVAGRNAYKSADVDAYMDEIYQSYEQMFRENAELVKKLGLLADKISEYKKDEDNIRNALLMAERMKDSIISEANDKAGEALAAAEEKVKAAKLAVDEKTAAIIEDAEKNAEKIIHDANDRAEETLKLAQSNATKLLAKAQEIYDEQVNTVKDEAEKEREYLDKIKEESAKIRQSLMDTYRTQIELLEYTPDFSEEVARMHAKKEEEAEAPETFADLVAAVPEEEAEAETEAEEEAEAEATEATEAEEEEIIEDDDFAAEKASKYIEDETEESDDASDADVDKYINGDAQDEFEDIDTGRSLFDEEEDYDEEEDFDKTVYTPES